MSERDSPGARHPLANKGTAFTESERRALGLDGWLPPRVESLAEQVERLMADVRARSTPLEQYLCLAAVQDENPTLFYRTLIDHLEETLPLVYTPTVGEACLQWSRLWQRPRGLYLTPHDRGRMRAMLERRAQGDVRVIVVTDGGRILGLGDLGANGMGIPVGKLALYVACAGVHPSQCLPVTLDVGTDNAALRADPFYLGLREPRLYSGTFDALVAEFLEAAQAAFPGVLVQFEDFGTVDALRLLARHREQYCCLNDDVQGTGAMGLAALYAAESATGVRLEDQRLLFFGAGAANTGIGRLFVAALRRHGLGEAPARERCWYFDSCGLVTAARAGLAEHKRPFAHRHAAVSDLAAAIEALRPTALIGASGQRGAFTPAVLEEMARINERPFIMALSNPTSKMECTAEEAWRASGGRALYACGSPCPPAMIGGTMRAAGQANNAHIFPGMGLGVLASRAARVTDEMFLAAAAALAGQVSDEDRALGRIMPATGRMREVAQAVAVAVANVAHERGIAAGPRPADMVSYVRGMMYQAEYGEAAPARPSA